MLKRAEDPGELQWHQCRWSAAVGRVFVLEDRMQLETGWLSFFRRGWSCADRTLNQFLCLHSRRQQEVKESWIESERAETRSCHTNTSGLPHISGNALCQVSHHAWEVWEYNWIHNSFIMWEMSVLSGYRDVSVAAAPQFHCNYTRLKLQFTPAVTHEERLDIYSRQNKQIQIQSSVCLQIHVRVSLAVF